MKPRRETREKKWPLEKLRFLDIFLLECGWREPRGHSVLQTIMTEADYRQAWEENKAEFLKLCEEPGPYRCSHKVCCKPGTRPGAWYMYDAPGERRQIPNPEFQAPRVGMLPSQIEWLEEPEIEFLERWGLLSEKEKRLLERREHMNSTDERRDQVVPFGRQQQLQEQDEDDEEGDNDEIA